MTAQAELFFIEHDALHARQAQCAAPQVVQNAAGGPDHHVRAGAQVPALRLDRLAPVDEVPPGEQVRDGLGLNGRRSLVFEVLEGRQGWAGSGRAARGSQVHGRIRPVRSSPSPPQAAGATAAKPAPARRLALSFRQCQCQPIRARAPSPGTRRDLTSVTALFNSVYPSMPEDPLASGRGADAVGREPSERCTPFPRG
jgi:hypothetical protein